MPSFTDVMAGIKQELSAQGIEISADEILKEYGGEMTNEELEMRHQEVLANAKPDEDGWDMYYCDRGGVTWACWLWFSAAGKPYKADVFGRKDPVLLEDGGVYLLGKVPRYGEKHE